MKDFNFQFLKFHLLKIISYPPLPSSLPYIFLHLSVRHINDLPGKYSDCTFSSQTHFVTNCTKIVYASTSVSGVV